MCFSVQVEKDLKELARLFKAEIAREEFFKLQDILKTFPQLGMKTPAEDGRVFPQYFAPVIKSDGGKRVIYPMRYRVRPRASKEEIPVKFNVFNARLDSLESRQTWQPLFGKNHGLIPLRKFYEWVPDENKKSKLISFFPRNHGMMWAPCLFDHWVSPDAKLSYYSFAIITTDPPAEILEMGHDRCPIFLKEKNIDLWLNEKSRSKAYEYLRDVNETFYDKEWP